MFQSEGAHQIVMSFSPPVAGCLLKKSSQKGPVTGTPGPPSLRPDDVMFVNLSVFEKSNTKNLSLKSHPNPNSGVKLSPKDCKSKG